MAYTGGRKEHGISHSIRAIQFRHDLHRVDCFPSPQNASTIAYMWQDMQRRVDMYGIITINLRPFRIQRKGPPWLAVLR